MNPNTQIPTRLAFHDGELVLPVLVDARQDTVWLNRQQMAELFGRDVKTIGKHISNALKEELEDSVVANFATTAADGKTYQVAYYNLNMIISVGYRVTRDLQLTIYNLRFVNIGGYAAGLSKARAGTVRAFLTGEAKIPGMSPAGRCAMIGGNGRGWLRTPTPAHPAVRRGYHRLIGVPGDPRHKDAVACAPSPLTGLQLARPQGAMQ